MSVLCFSEETALFFMNSLQADRTARGDWEIAGNNNINNRKNFCCILSAYLFHGTSQDVANFKKILIIFRVVYFYDFCHGLS